MYGFLCFVPIKSGQAPVGKASYSCPDKGHRGGNGKGKILNSGIVSFASQHFAGRGPSGQ